MDSCLILLHFQIQQFLVIIVFSVTKAHHLLSLALCQHGDHPVSTQRRCRAQASAPSTDNGKRINSAFALFFFLSEESTNVDICLFDSTAAPRGHGKPCKFNKTHEGPFEGDRSQQQLHPEGLQLQCYTLNGFLKFYSERVK